MSGDIPFDAYPSKGDEALTEGLEAAIFGIKATREVLEQAFDPNLDDPILTLVEKSEILNNTMPYLVGISRVALEMAERAEQREARKREKETDASARRPAPREERQQSRSGGGGGGRRAPARGRGGGSPDGDAKARNSELIRAVGRDLGTARGQETYDEVNQIMEAAGVNATGGLAYDSMWEKVVDAAEAAGVSVDASVG